MTTGLLSIGASALDAAYTALQTTGNNIANANTPGYSREVTSFTPQISTSIGGMYLGTGVQVDAISRVYSNFLGQQTNVAQAAASQADSAATLTGQINGLFSNSSTGIGASIDNFFTQIQALTSNAGSAATRVTTLAAAQQMAGQFNGYYAQLQSMSQSTQEQIAGQISTVNTTVSQIASLNDQISLATASGQSPNSLLDERNQDILTLNQSIGVTTTTQSNGAIDLYLANGQPLLVGDKTYALTMGQNPANAQGIVVGTSNGSGINALDPNNSGGGTIGALLQFQSQTIPDVENQIGQLAVTLSSQMNALQTQGTDQIGVAGSNFFSTPTITTSAASTNSDAGTVALSASYSDVTQLQASNYSLSVNNGSYTLTQLSNGTQTTYASLPITVDGMTLSLNGTPADGDSFYIQPTQFGAANISVALTDGSQIAAASPLQAALASTNAGSLAVSNLGLQALPANPNAQLNDTVTLNFTSPTQFTYTDTTTGVTSAAQTYTAGSPINVNGWSLTLTGAPANGDSVSVSPSGSGSADARNADLMAQLQSQGIVNGSTLDQAYSGVVAAVGTLASTATTNQTSADAILQSATTAESSVSGVNLDEEASSLLQFQQQYQAAAQMITAANTIFTALLTDVNAT
jgi:flagellar hook-associated protein 1 FlgK